MSSLCLISSSVYFYSSTTGEPGESYPGSALTTFSPSFFGDLGSPECRANVFNFFYKSAISCFLA